MGIGVWELLLLFLIVLVVFGTKRLRNIGGDLGGAIKSFRSAMSESEDKDKPSGDTTRTIEGEVVDKKEKDKV
ncbi:twin-arginine translocase TatA/TatE family subunit [Methylococcus geothermalis]|uniref:Sec-independent protein translocase protein TatA n=1 Tax=Methylococcus geothermalis TaxID=2681310 RepID=A0A858Q8F2_9GAMM|nr:twin-arginine translocase TatA/TatE family subunit [Methylococcus geothermalis]QJD30129.1 twin-arginine translocase TatA/TatE family subunit [Methylococcus geothermalis]